MLSRGFAMAFLPVVLITASQTPGCPREPARCADSPAPVNESWEPAADQPDREIWLDDLRQRRNTFSQLADRVTDELMLGEIDLRAAVDRILYFCLQNYPEHLHHVTDVEPGADIRIKLAHSLVRAVRCRLEERHPELDPRPVLARIKRELHDIDAQPEGWK
jgi:hypothetical protein